MKAVEQILAEIYRHEKQVTDCLLGDSDKGFMCGKYAMLTELKDFILTPEPHKHMVVVNGVCRECGEKV